MKPIIHRINAHCIFNWCIYNLPQNITQSLPSSIPTYTSNRKSLLIVHPHTKQYFQRTKNNNLVQIEDKVIQEQYFYDFCVFLINSFPNFKSDKCGISILFRSCGYFLPCFHNQFSFGRN